MSESLIDPIDQILAEIVVRIQLPPSKHRLAVERYETVCNWVQREESPLRDHVAQFYPQGSMAIGSTIAARGHSEEYDIDIVAALSLPRDSHPTYVLDLLFDAIRGERKSLYFESVTRRSRCVTIHYADHMHLDITPVIRTNNPTERISLLFHDDPNRPYEMTKTLLMNSWGFCDWFTTRTSDHTGFAAAFSEQVQKRDARSEAEFEPVSPQEDLTSKSIDVMALQLIKRYRNTKQGDRPGRMSPSILLSKMVGNAARPDTSLLESFQHHATSIHSQFVAAERRGQLVDERNPTCHEDCFTDRWPVHRTTQQFFIEDLHELLTVLEMLRQGDLGIAEIQDLLVGLFGDAPVTAAVRATQEKVGIATQSGNTLHRVGGGILIGAAAATTVARVARASTNFGGELPK